MKPQKKQKNYNRERAVFVKKITFLLIVIAVITVMIALNSAPLQ